MFAEERKDKIIEILNETGKVVVKELSQKFDVTEDCIRKDLKSLEKHEILKRTYGGAVLLRKTLLKNDMFNRKNVSLEAKRKIAEKAFDMIQPRETIFLDISSTNIILAQKIAASNKKLTVISNMVDVVSAFSNCEHVEVIGIGGIFHKELNGFIGSTAIESISKYRVHKAFVGSCGVNMYDMSITTFDVEDGNTKRMIMNVGKKIYIVMETRKFYLDGTYKFADLYEIDGIILDEAPEEKINSTLNEMSVDII